MVIRHKKPGFSTLFTRNDLQDGMMMATAPHFETRKLGFSTNRQALIYNHFIGVLLSTLVLAGCDQQVMPENPSPGRLGYIGEDGNVYITSGDLTGQQVITKDATTRIEGSGLSYHRIAWSPAGQLANAAVERDGENVISKL